MTNELFKHITVEELKVFSGLKKDMAVQGTDYFI